MRAAEEVVQAPAGPGGLAVLRGAGGLGALHRLAAAALEAPEAAVVVVGDRWSLEDGAAGALIERLGEEPGACFACAVFEGFGAWDLSAAGLMARPLLVGPVALRMGEVRRLGLPDWGPPDLVLDANAAWALVTAVALRGGRGVVVRESRARRTSAEPEDADRLRPEGLAWLASRGMRWGPLEPGLARALWRAWSPAIGPDGLGCAG